MTRTRLELLQWYALFGGALAWTAEHVIGYFVSVASCSTSVAYWHVSLVLWESLLTAVTLAGVLAAESAALVVYRATAAVDDDAPGPAGRMHFFAQAALLGNVLFFMLVVLDCASVLYHSNCRLA
ncbi:MAG: hypothetical protein ACJ76I_10705 [Gaiellaceae bacterium]